MSASSLAWSEERLQIVCARLDYELQMLGSLPEHVVRFDQGGPALLKNACLEALLMHARNLIDFLRDEPPKRKTDVVARRFLSEDTSFFSRDQHTDWARRISRWVVHLTDLAEPADPLPAFFLTDLIAGILLEMTAFASRLIDEGSPYGRTIKGSVERAHSSFSQLTQRWPAAPNRD